MSMIVHLTENYYPSTSRSDECPALPCKSLNINFASKAISSVSKFQFTLASWNSSNIKLIWLFGSVMISPAKLICGTALRLFGEIYQIYILIITHTPVRLSDAQCFWRDSNINSLNLTRYKGTVNWCIRFPLHPPNDKLVEVLKHLKYFAIRKNMDVVSIDHLKPAVPSKTLLPRGSERQECLQVHYPVKHQQL